MSLTKYKRKRNFSHTSEPKGKRTKNKSKLSFVVQRHKASHLHYDFRLELGGVLKSWAVPKGPSLNPQDKRLAMMVEDHPYDYKDFAGIIPEGNYGAGIVEIWDKGTYNGIEGSENGIEEKKIRAGLHAGNLKFTLHGKKLKGDFALVKLKAAQDNAWLLIKHKDKYAVDSEYSSETDTAKNSPINKWLQKNKKKDPVKKKVSVKAVEANISHLKKESKKYLPGKTSKLNNYIKPMLAKEIEEPFDDKDWIFEIKWDGYRAVAEVDKGNVSIYSRKGNTFNDSYPAIADELKKLNIHATLDGEVVVVDENGKANFQLLQHYDNEIHTIRFEVFDLISLNGQDTCDLPLIDRKKLLKQLLNKKNKIIQYSDHIKEKGVDFFKAAVKNNLEGIIAKKADSQYYPGIRISEWLKIKHHKSLEAIITGFTEPSGERKYFGALVLGMRSGKKLKYIGHTGSGFDSQGLKEMHLLLQPLIQEHSPFEEVVKTNMPVTWVKPTLVCEIKYTERTRDGRLRHPIFLRLRDDKNANEITIEDIMPVKKKKTEKLNKDGILSFGKIEVKTSNLSKVYWPEKKLTKGDLINYYQSISKFILPYLKDRPQSLKRNPNGIIDSGFFHKDAGDEAPSWVKSKALYSKSTSKYIDYIICNDAPTLAYLNNLGCIELNPWHSTLGKLDNPDYLIIDIDPSEKNTFDQVIETALVIRDVLKKAGADCYCKTSGATGMHVYIPIQKKYTYEQVKDFALLICMLTREKLPEFTSLERNLKKRGNKMIYLDHLQNRKGQTISCVYSLRPTEEASVSTPLLWKEVKPGLDPTDFNIHNTLKRLQKKRDLFSAILGKGIDLKKCLTLLDK